MDQLGIYNERAQWRWAYRDGNGVELLSNQLYAHRSEAEQAARLAYPDARLDDPEPAEASDRRLLLAIVVLLLVVIGLGIVLKRVEGQEEGE